ncbi:MAG: DUF2807 domain-containing protein [Bacteroidales bacterium]|nr:DUF2807 domain-containing protein [Bacteroidales bacterium]
MKKISILLAAAALLTLPSCRFIKVSDEIKQEIKDNITVNYNNGDSDAESITPSDNIISRDFVSGDFQSLRCNVPGDIRYTPGDCAVSVSGPDNVLSHLLVQNENGALVIKFDGVRVRNLKNLKIDLSSPVLEDLTVNGAADFDAPQGISSLDFSAVVNGAADLDIQGLKTGKARIVVNGAGDAEINGIDCEELVVSINGAGDAEVSGHARKADLSISGAGDIDASSLKADEFNSKVRGIGQISRPKK